MALNTLAYEFKGATVPVTAIVTAYKRVEQTLKSLGKLEACMPRADEIIVHVDGNQTACAEAIRRTFPGIRILVSGDSIGPGGGRNKLVAEARNEIVASFDDDSYPLDADYFGRVMAMFTRFPEASILSAAIYHQGETIQLASETVEWVADFIGCGCVYRRHAFLQTSGYVPLAVAYGMEEVDIALRFLAEDKKILKTAWLRVFHDTRLQHHSNPEIVAASIANLALLAFLRYPISMWPLGAAQCLKRIQFLVKRGRLNGILHGVWMIPAYVWSRRQLRQPLRRATVNSFLNLRRQPVRVESLS